MSAYRLWVAEPLVASPSLVSVVVSELQNGMAYTLQLRILHAADQGEPLQAVALPDATASIRKALQKMKVGKGENAGLVAVAGNSGIGLLWRAAEGLIDTTYQYRWKADAVHPWLPWKTIPAPQIAVMGREAETAVWFWKSMYFTGNSLVCVKAACRQEDMQAGFFLHVAPGHRHHVQSPASYTVSTTATFTSQTSATLARAPACQDRHCRTTTSRASGPANGSPARAVCGRAVLLSLTRQMTDRSRL